MKIETQPHFDENAIKAALKSRIEMIAIESIKIGTRHRKDMGDIAGLAASIEAIGLLHPITLTPNRTLLAGRRRLEACELLGWTEIPATVLEPPDV